MAVGEQCKIIAAVITIIQNYSKRLSAHRPNRQHSKAQNIWHFCRKMAVIWLISPKNCCNLNNIQSKYDKIPDVSWILSFWHKKIAKYKIFKQEVFCLSFSKTFIKSLISRCFVSVYHRPFKYTPSLVFRTRG